VSVSLWKTRPLAWSSAFNGAKFSMIPLCATLARPAVCGWALDAEGAPWVAQRVWPIPTVAAIGSAASTASSSRILPLARRRSTCPPTTPATPAES